MKLLLNFKNTIGILPIYVNELSPKNLKGLIGTLNQVLAVLGKLIANILGLSSLLGTKELWPLLVSVLFFPLMVHMGLFFLVESPKYLLINKDNKEEAKLGKST